LYAVSDGAYFFLVALSEMGRTKGKSGGGKKGGKKGGHRLMGGKSKSSKGSKEGGKYEVAIIDFPEGSFVLRDASGQVVGSRIPAAIDDIVLNINSLATEDIEKVQMVYSHAHFDHIGGATITYEHILNNWDAGGLDIEIIAHKRTLEEFEDRIAANFFSFRAPLPTLVIDEETTFELGNDVEYSLLPTSGHSDEKDLVVFFEAEGSYPAVMMFVDVVFPGWAPFFSFAITTDLFAFLKVHEILLNHFDLGDDGIFVGGHLTKLGSKADIELSYEFTQDVMDGALQGLNTVDSGAVGAASGVFDQSSTNYGNQWVLFDDYFKAVIKVCAKQVVAKYGCVLASVDFVVDSHCRVAQSFWRLDY
jgi:glyoxylase-like metal-dependent hydrolase (beta-lactamase superfamily II)